MTYTRRSFEILQVLLNQDGYTSWEKVARSLDIAKRTIFRELHTIEALVNALGMTLHRKTRQGIYLEANAQQRSTFNDWYSRCSDMAYTQEERHAFILGQLLKDKSPQKLFVFASQLEVSEATISHDMDKLMPWLKKRDLTLNRKPGLGVYLSGDESAFRRALVDYLYDNYEHQALIDLLQSIHVTSDLKEGVLDHQVLIKINNTLSEFDGTLHERLTDNAYMSLAIHLAIAVQRIQRGEGIEMAPPVLQALHEDIQFEIARAIGERIEAVTGVSFPEDELGYITMHLKGAKLKSTSTLPHSDIVLTNFEMTQLAARMVKAFDNLSGWQLSRDEDLLVGLVSHLKPAVTRLKLNLTIRNPLLSQIQDLYPEIFSLTATVSKTIEEAYHIELPEGEIGYLAMHFGAAIERSKRAQRQTLPIRIALVCASGIGTSSLLASRISKVFEDVVLVGQYSKQHIENLFLGGDQGGDPPQDIEMVVSTVPLVIQGVPVILVNPLLSSEDKGIIQVALRAIQDKRSQIVEANRFNVTQRRGLSIQEQAQRMFEMSEAVLKIAEYFSLKMLDNSQQKVFGLEAFLKSIVESLGDLDIGEDQLVARLALREQLGSTVITGEGIQLLHTKVKGSSAKGQVPLFAVRYMHVPFQYLGREPITWVIVMLVPEDATKALLSLFSWLSKGLIEDASFLAGIKSNNEAQCFESLSLRMHHWLYHRKDDGKDGGYHG